VGLLPLWIAPNLITIVGLIVNIVTALILLGYNPDGKTTNSPPAWTYLLCALGLFIYQSLDAIGEEEKYSQSYFYEKKRNK
jgi:ethanolaminephosphotransferase